MPNKKKRGFSRVKKSKEVTKETPNRSTKRKMWSEEQMQAAMESAQSGKLSINKSAEIHGIPRTTLKNRLSGKVQHGRNPGPCPYLSSTEEKELSSYLLSSAQVGYGKTRREVKCIVESVAREKGVLRVTKISDGWWRRFLERNPMLSLRSGDATSGIRMDAVNKENVMSYFQLLKDVMDELKLADHPECIYNMDETGVPLEPRPPKIVALKGVKKIRYRSSGQKAQITVIGCGSATGQSIPPFIIFSAKQLNPLWMKDEVAGSRFAVSDKGWIDRELFFYWLKDHFLVNAISRRPLLLLLDGHSSHFEPSTIRFAKENDCVVFCLPPHTTHECQPLDCSFFGPLKIHWQQACHTFYQQNPGQVISKLNFCRIFKKAWLEAVSPSNIISGFRKSGVFPFNPDVVSLAHNGNSTETSDIEGDKTVHFNSDLDSSGCSETMGNGGDKNSNKLPSVLNADDNKEIKEVSSFSPEQEELYQHRFEESYDLYDPSYTAWLELNHPEAVPSDRYTLAPASDSIITAVATPESCAKTLQFSVEEDVAKCLHVTNLSACTSTSCDETPISSIMSPPVNSELINAVESSPLSPLSKFLKPMPFSISTPKSRKTDKKTGARVLTSRECLSLLEEKEMKKKQEAEEKEKRRLEREIKKKQRLVEMQRKAEERQRKVDDRKQKAKEKNNKAKKPGKGVARRENEDKVDNLPTEDEPHRKRGRMVTNNMEFY